VRDIEYPLNFVQRVKDAFPGWVKLHQLVDADSYNVGRYLDDGTQAGTHIPSQDVVDAFTATEAESVEQRLAKLKERAEQGMLKRSLYVEWLSYAPATPRGAVDDAD
jgi:hypothetical protein